MFKKLNMVLIILLFISVLSTVGIGSPQPIGPYYNDSVFVYGDDGLSLNIGISDGYILKVDDADAAVDDYCKLTANGVVGRDYSEVKTDLSLNNVENTALSTWIGTENITTLGTIGTGTWEGTAIADGYIPNDITIDLATLATTLTIVDNESTNENNAVLFTSGGAGSGDLNIEADGGDFYYNPSTGTLAVTVLDLTTVLAVSEGGTNSGTALNNSRVMVSSGGAIVESVVTTAELGRLDGLGGVIVTDVTACTDLEGTKLSIAGEVLNCTETDSVVGAVTGIVLSDGGGNISASAVADTLVLYIDGATNIPSGEAGFTYTKGTDTLAVVNITCTAISGTLTGTASVAATGDAAVDFFGAGVDAVTDATTCTDIEGTLLSITGVTLNVTIPEDHINATMLKDDNTPADEDIFTYEATGTTGHWMTKAELTIASSGANTDITSLAGLTTPLSPAYGGTGVANAAGETITLVGDDAITFTTSAATNVTLPTSGTLVNSAVTTLSSLVSIGTIVTGVWEGTDVGLAHGGTGVSTGAMVNFTSILNVALYVGRDADNQIKFATDNTIVFRLSGVDGASFISTGELDMGAHSAGFTLQTATGDGTTTIDWRLGLYFKFTHGDMAETFTFTAPTNPCHMTLMILEDANGAHDCTWPAAVTWLGAEPTWTDGGANKTIVVALAYDGTTYWAQGTPWEE